MTPARPVYANQPVRSVSLETYFRGQFSVYSSLHEVQQRYRLDFPDLFVPNLQVGEAAALRPYQLRSHDQSAALALALNQITFVSFAYEGHQAFLARAVPILEGCLRLCEVEELDRVVYRYENDIGIQRNADGSLPLSDILRLDLGLGGGEPPILHELALAWTRAWDKGTLHTAIGVEGKEASRLRFTIAAEMKPTGASSGLTGYATAAHNCACAYFEGMITDEFRAVIGNDPSQVEAKE